MDIRYFDNAATTKIKEEVLEEMLPYLKEEYGNASSLYTIGRSAKRAIEKARKQVAELINANPEEIYFTSCGSESDNTIIKGIANINTSKIRVNIKFLNPIFVAFSDFIFAPTSHTIKLTIISIARTITIKKNPFSSKPFIITFKFSEFLFKL